VLGSHCQHCPLSAPDFAVRLFLVVALSRFQLTGVSKTVVDQCRALMSTCDWLRATAPPRTKACGCKHQQHRVRQFGDVGIHTGAQAASLRAISVPPNEVVGGVDDIAAIRLLPPEVDRGPNSVVLLREEKIMTLSVTIPDELAEELSRTAQAVGKTPEEVAVSAIRRNLLATAKLNETLAPIREAFQKSGLTEDEAVELFEAEKHAMRSERAAADR
jgi:hypothetical protein